MLQALGGVGQFALHAIAAVKLVAILAEVGLVLGDDFVGQIRQALHPSRHRHLFCLEGVLKPLALLRQIDLADQRAGEAPPCAHEPEVHRDRLVVAVEVLEEALPNLRAQDRGAIDAGIDVLAADLVAHLFEFTDSPLGVHELARAFVAKRLQKAVELLEVGVHRNLFFGDDVGREAAGLIEAVKDLVSQTHIRRHDLALAGDGQRCRVGEARVRIARQFGMYGRGHCHRLAHPGRVPVDGAALAAAEHFRNLRRDGSRQQTIGAGRRFFDATALNAERLERGLPSVHQGLCNLRHIARASLRRSAVRIEDVVDGEVVFLSRDREGGVTIQAFLRRVADVGVRGVELAVVAGGGLDLRRVESDVQGLRQRCFGRHKAPTRPSVDDVLDDDALVALRPRPTNNVIGAGRLAESHLAFEYAPERCALRGQLRRRRIG